MGEDTEMKFHYDKILEQKLVPLTEGTEGPPAWLVICLAGEEDCGNATEQHRKEEATEQQ